MGSRPVALRPHLRPGPRECQGQERVSCRRSRAAALKTVTARVTVAKPSGGPGSVTVLCILDFKFPAASGTLLFVGANPAAAGNVGSLIELHELRAGRSIIRNESGAARK